MGYEEAMDYLKNQADERYEEDERFQALTAERDQLRAQLETASGNARLYADKCTALEAAVEPLRVESVAQHENWKKIMIAADGRANRATARAEAAESTVAGLRRALEEGKADRWAATVGNTETNAFAPSPWVLMAETALAASPADHERAFKAEALRSTAAELESLRDHIQEYIGPDDARDDIRRICWNRAKDLRDKAGQLEAANATR